MAKARAGQGEGAEHREAKTALFVERLMRRPPELAFDARMEPARLPAWRAQVRRRLREVLALPRVPAQPPPRLVGEEPRPGYRLQRWELYPEPLSVVPFLVLVPDSASRATPAPAVLCFPGSGHPKEMLCGEPWEGDFVNQRGEREHMALHFARAGFVAAAFDNPGTASLLDPSRPDWRRQADHLAWLGRSYEALCVFQRRAALAWLRRRPFVDPRRLAVCGHSLGAKPALLMGVLDDGIRAVIWNDMAGNWRERDVLMGLQPAPPWHYIPGFARWFDYIDLMCALAPTPLLITEGGVLKDHAHIRKAYGAAGCPAAVRITFMPSFRDPRTRWRGRPPSPMDAAAYARYANYDSDHYFKGDVAVPWLCRLFGLSVPRGPAKDAERGG